MFGENEINVNPQSCCTLCWIWILQCFLQKRITQQASNSDGRYTRREMLRYVAGTMLCGVHKGDIASLLDIPFDNLFGSSRKFCWLVIDSSLRIWSCIRSYSLAILFFFHRWLVTVHRSTRWESPTEQTRARTTLKKKIASWWVSKVSILLSMLCLIILERSKS